MNEEGKGGGAVERQRLCFGGLVVRECVRACVRACVRV